MNLWLIPILPFCGFLINGIFGRRLPKPLVNLFAVGSVALSFAWVLRVVFGLMPIEHAYVEHYYNWIQSGALTIATDFAVDRLTAVMLLIVTGVGLLIHIYSIGYMAHEGGYYRFFAYMNLFMFFMLVLVLAENYLLMFVGWEGVGLCSYLLIGFYFREKFATDAGNKAFIVNRIGDFGFSLAVFLIFRQFGSLDFHTVFGKVGGMGTEPVLTLIGFLLLVGACGKSAQIPLYVWLPDAMAGPTPVSALIHAATMVTAGVYMTARSAPIYNHAPDALMAIAIVGIVTAFFSATIGMTQFDIKKVYAYSTVSQLGYMFVGVGSGVPAAGIYHVMTHAFFKALLFLGAGSVIHAMSGEQDLRKMGGLRKHAPITCWTLFCASIAISGVPFTSGYFSKDEILVGAFHAAPWIYWVGVITAGMTAFYVFRAWIMAFFGEPRSHTHPHESPWSMLGPLTILAALSLGGGFINIPKWLEPVFGANEAPAAAWMKPVAIFAGLFGIFLAFLFYMIRPALADQFANGLGGLYRLVYNKYFVDEVYAATIVEPVVQGSKNVLWRGVDVEVIDGVVNGIGARSKGVGSIFKLMQAGNVRSYAAWVVFGSVLLLIVIGLGIGGLR